MTENKSISEPLKAVMLVHDDCIDRRVLDEARSLIKAGWEVIVVAALPPEPTYRKDEEAYPEVEIVRVDPYSSLEEGPIPNEFITSAQINWRHLFLYCDHFYHEAVKRPATVYVAHDLPQLLPALMAGAYHHAYVLYDAHELYPDQSYFIQTHQVEKLTEVERWLAPYADQIITVNKSIAEFMTIRYGVQLPEIILNCPAMPKQMGLPIPNTDILRQELGIPQTKKIILYQGIYSLARNLQGVIAAMGLVKNPNVVFVLMGPGLEKDNELMHQAKNMGILNSKVFFRAAVDQDHLLLYSASADAGIIPYPYTELNNYFCTPNKLFEFIVAGIPILANDLPELNRFVAQQGVGINLPLRTPKEISDAIDSFFSLDNIAYRLRAQSVSEKFTWDSQSEKLVNIYSALFNKPARFKTSQEEILPPKVLWDKETQKPDIQSNDDKPPEYSKNSEVQLSFKHMPPQNPISIPFALQPYSTIVLLNEIKRRLIIRAHQILQKL